MQVQNLFARMEVTSDRQTLFRFLSHADQHVMYPHVTLQTLCRHPAVLDAGHTRQGYIMENPCPSIVTLLLEKQHRLFAGRADPESSHHQSRAQKKNAAAQAADHREAAAIESKKFSFNGCLVRFGDCVL